MGSDKRQPLVLAIGIFDGVHRGHQAILKKAKTQARRLGARAAVLTFPSHPSRVLNPSHPVPLMQTFEQRSALFRRFGIVRTYPLQFTKSLSRLRPADFVNRVLFRQWNLRGVVVGRTFRFGHGRTGGIGDLRRLLEPRGCGVWPVEPVRMGNVVVQSTIIRRALLSGKIERAAKLLGHAVELIGRAERGAGMGVKTGARTVNLSIENELLPRFGVYAGWIRADGKTGTGRRPAVMNLGVAPTVRRGRKVLLEAHVLDRRHFRVRTGTVFRVEMVEFFRPERKFADLAALKRAIRRDVKHARRILIWKKW